MPTRHFIPRDFGKIPYRGKKFFFDTNVWLHINGPFIDPRSEKLRTYSSLLKNILANGGIVVIDALVMAEFVNRFLRDNHKVLVNAGEAEANFKAFRATPKYQEITSSLADELYHLLRNTQKINTDFAAIDMDECVAKFAENQADFNDVMYWRSCLSQGLCLVTDDRDCFFDNIEVVSANSKILHV